MTGKEKLIASLNHREGPIPFDLGATAVTGIHCLALSKLRAYYGLEKRLITIIDPYQMLGQVDDDLRAAIGISTAPVWGPKNLFGSKLGSYMEWKTPWGQAVLFPDNLALWEDERYVYVHAEGDANYPPSARMPKTGYFFDSIMRQNGEIDDDALKLEDNLEEFGALGEDDLNWFKAAKEALKPQYGAVGNFGGTALGDIALVPGPMLKNPKGIRDVEEWYISTVARTDFVSEIFAAQAEIALKNLKKLWEAVGDAVQAVCVCGTDFGTQSAPFCSAAKFKSLYAPHYRKINGWIHEHTPWKTFKHSCGSIMPLIPELIDAGFDILNPVQWNANNMGAKELKQSFGKELTFWGGGVDTQRTLQFGAPEEVYAQVLEMCEIFGKGGGFVFNTVHNIQATVPVENLAAMVKALNAYNGC